MMQALGVKRERCSHSAWGQSPAITSCSPAPEFDFPTKLPAGFCGMPHKEASGENSAKHLQANLAGGPGAWWGFTCHCLALGYPRHWSSPRSAELNLQQQQLPSPSWTPDVKKGQITFSVFGQSGDKLNAQHKLSSLPSPSAPWQL